MQIELTPEDERRIRETREFVAREVSPHAAEVDARGALPGDLLQTIGAEGLLDLGLGGAEGRDAFDAVLVVEEVAAACASSGLHVAASNLFVGDVVRRLGRGGDLATFIETFISEVKSGSVSVCLASGGSEAPLRARRDGDDYVVDGVAPHVRGAANASWALIVAELSPRASEETRHVVFLSSLDDAGIRRGPARREIGLRGVAPADLSFEAWRVDATRCLGGEERGDDVARSLRDAEDLGLAAVALGVGRSALELAIRHIRSHDELARQQLVHFEVADLATRLDASRLMVWRAAREHHAVKRDATLAAMARLMATEMASFVTGEVARLGGGSVDPGEEARLERLFRDAKMTEFYRGSSAVMRSRIAEVLIED